MKNIGKSCAGIGVGRAIATGDNSQNCMHGLMRYENQRGMDSETFFDRYQKGLVGILEYCN